MTDNKKASSEDEAYCGGQGGIRTHEGLAPLPVFKTGAFNRSATCPLEPLANRINWICHAKTEPKAKFFG